MRKKRKTTKASTSLAHEIERKYHRELSMMRRVHALAAHVSDTATIEDVTTSNVVPHLAVARVAKLLHAIDVLFCAGLETEAMCQVRALADLRVDITFLVTHPEHLDRFYEFASVSNVDLYDRLTKVFGEKTKTGCYEGAYQQHRDFLESSIQSPADFRKAVERDAAAARAKWEYGWTWADVRYDAKKKENNDFEKKFGSARKRAREVKLAPEYDLCYCEGSRYLHTNMASLGAQLKLDPAGHRTVAGAAAPLNRLWLVVCIPMGLGVIEQAADFYGVAFDPVRPELERVRADWKSFLDGETRENPPAP